MRLTRFIPLALTMMAAPLAVARSQALSPSARVNIDNLRLNGESTDQGSTSDDNGERRASRRSSSTGTDGSLMFAGDLLGEAGGVPFGDGYVGRPRSIRGMRSFFRTTEMADAANGIEDLSMAAAASDADARARGDGYRVNQNYLADWMFDTPRTSNADINPPATQAFAHAAPFGDLGTSQALGVAASPVFSSASIYTDGWDAAVFDPSAPSASLGTLGTRTLTVTEPTTNAPQVGALAAPFDPSAPLLVTPEPSTLYLVGTGAAGLLGMYTRRRGPKTSGDEETDDEPTPAAESNEQ